MNNVEVVRAWAAWVKTSRSVCGGVTPAPEKRVAFTGSDEPSPFLKFATSDGGLLSIWSNKTKGDFTVGPVVWFGGNAAAEVLVLGNDAVEALAVLAGLGSTTLEEFWLGGEPDSPNRALTHWLRQTHGAAVPQDIRDAVQSVTDSSDALFEVLDELMTP